MGMGCRIVIWSHSICMLWSVGNAVLVTGMLNEISSEVRLGEHVRAVVVAQPHRGLAFAWALGRLLLVCIGFPGGSEGLVRNEADRVALRGDADRRLILVLYPELWRAT